MAFRLNKKFTVIIAIVLFVIAAGAAVFVYIRINREEEVLPDESRAGSDCCCNCLGDGFSCPDGYHQCDEHHNDVCGTEPGHNTACCCEDQDPTPGNFCHSEPDGTCEPSNDCNFKACPSQTGASPGKCQVECCNSDCAGQVTSRGYDICRGKLTNGNCQKCDNCDPNSPPGCDLACHCDNANPNTCYEKGGGYDYYERTGEPNLVPYYDCRNTQADCVYNGGYGGWNCTWEDGRNWQECVPDEKYVNVRGKVFCQDPGESEQYPVQGARIVFQKSNGQNETVTTGPEGGFVTAQEQTELDQGPFSVVFDGITDPSRTLSNGWEYSEMTGPSLQNQTVCSRGSCGDCGDNYTSCTGFSEGTEAGFRWVFENCSGEPGIPGWDIEKTGNTVCYEENTEDVYAEIIYDVEITYTNTDSEEQGYIESVTDTYDPTIEQEWIISTDPQDSEITDTTITWNLSEEQRTFDVGESLILHYTVRVPKEGFEYTYNNQVDAEVQDSDETLSDDFSIWVTCEGYEPGPLPPTGVFDSTAVRIGLGIVLVGLGFAYYKFGWFDDSLLWLSDSIGKFTGKVRFDVTKEGRKRKWEKGLLSKVEDKSKDD